MAIQEKLKGKRFEKPDDQRGKDMAEKARSFFSRFLIPTQSSLLYEYPQGYITNIPLGVFALSRKNGPKNRAVTFLRNEKIRFQKQRIAKKKKIKKTKTPYRQSHMPRLQK
jgi:hypothetical protein